MRIRLTWRSLAVCGLALLSAMPAMAAAPAPADSSANERHDAEIELTDENPIIATVIEIDDHAGRVTLDTPHGRVDLTIGPDMAGRLSLGDKVVLRIIDDESDFPSALPRQEPVTPEPSNKI